MEKERKTKYGAVVSAIAIAMVCGILVTANMDSLVDFRENQVVDKLLDVVTPPEPKWRTIQVITPEMIALGEADPGDDDTGWLATFCLDYAETPATCLASNASNGSYDSWGNVSGYVDTDDTETDLVSEDPFYFVVRCRFNDTVKSGGLFQGSRCRVILNVTGDETINTVYQTGDNSDTTGGGQVSMNNSGYDYIYINFYWDDNSDGYRILDDGSLAWNIVIQARY